MPRRRNRDYQTTSQIGRYLRRPIVQLTIVSIVVLPVWLIASPAREKFRQFKKDGVQPYAVFFVEIQ